MELFLFFIGIGYLVLAIPAYGYFDTVSQAICWRIFRCSSVIEEVGTD